MDLLRFRDNAANRDVISLFSGAMGLDIGLAKAGLNIVIGQDFAENRGHFVFIAGISAVDKQRAAVVLYYRGIAAAGRFYKNDLGFFGYLMLGYSRQERFSLT